MHASVELSQAIFFIRLWVSTGLAYDGANIWVSQRLNNTVTKLLGSDGAARC
jgi:hypothetical protein